jgi:hypothetical protein
LPSQWRAANKGLQLPTSLKKKVSDMKCENLAKDNAVKDKFANITSAILSALEKKGVLE